MKKSLVILGSLFLMCLFFCSCEKQVIKERCECPPLPSEIIGNWKWEQRKQYNQNWEQLNMGVLQNISINDSMIVYPAMQSFNCFYFDLGCSVVSGISASQNVKVSIYQDTLYFEGINDGIFWKLSRL